MAYTGELGVHCKREENELMGLCQRAMHLTKLRS